ncbi:MAG TPA: hypothetical protein VHL34_07885 [Rhizomicrobium sp.]|jgi:hypothetical protein|nr:hypothetical protein [Rhizomicrobium sp.]
MNKQDPTLRALWFNAVWFFLFSTGIGLVLFPFLWSYPPGFALGSQQITSLPLKLGACFLSSWALAVGAFLLIGNGFVYFATQRTRGKGFRSD